MVTLRQWQPEPLSLLDRVEERAEQVVDPTLLSSVRTHVEHVVADGPEPAEPCDERERAVAAVIDQMLVDVASLDDETVRTADAWFPPGALADLVLASYAWEARTRLAIAADRLLGGLG